MLIAQIAIVLSLLATVGIGFKKVVNCWITGGLLSTKIIKSANIIVLFLLTLTIIYETTVYIDKKIKQNNNDNPISIR